MSVIHLNTCLGSPLSDSTIARAVSGFEQNHLPPQYLQPPF